MNDKTSKNANRCAIKAGFFLLRGCDNSANTTCASCLRPICTLHALPMHEQTWCTECAAVFNQNNTAKDKADQNDPKKDAYYARTRNDDDSLVWAYQYRNHYYTAGGISAGLLAEHGFSPEEAAAFATTAPVDESVADDAATDLFDS